jgi:hypothetical protein
MSTKRILLTTTLLLISCHKSEPTPAPTPHVAQQPVADSCLVLTSAEISAALGIPVDPGKHTLATSDLMCNWPRTGAAPATEPALVLNFNSLAVFNREKAASGNVKVTPATGIGDEAFYVTSQLGTSLLIRKGNTTIGFSIHDKTLPTPKAMAMENTLGMEAAARI